MRHEGHAVPARRRVALGGLALGLLGMAVVAGGDEPRRLTLEEALAMAEKGPLAQAAGFEIQRVRAEKRGAGLWPNPEIQFDRESVGEEVERIAAVSLALPVSGRLGLERSAARSAVTAAERRGGQERIERRARVREAFLDLLAAQERDRVLDDGLGRLDHLVKVVRAREVEGESSGYDRMRVEQERADLAAQRLDARGALARAQGGLAWLLGLASEPMTAEGTLAAGATLFPDTGEARAQALGRGDVEALSAEADQRDLLGRAAGRRAVPEPSLLVGRKTACAGGACGSGAALGFTVSVPLFDRGQGPSAALRAEAAIARARRAALGLQAAAEADAALAEVRAGREAEAVLSQAPSPERILGIAQASYEVGEVRIFELLDAYRSALSVTLRATEIRLAVRKAEVALDRATGTERMP